MTVVSKLSFELDMDSMSDMVDHVNLRMDSAIDDMVEEVEWEWRRLAATTPRLKSTRKRYLASIAVERDGDEVVLSLNDKLMASMELGSEPYDLKPGFLKGATHRIIPISTGSSSSAVRFRTVTSSSSGWIHPGFKPMKLVDQVKAEVEASLLKEVITNAFSRTLI